MINLSIVGSQAEQNIAEGGLDLDLPELLGGAVEETVFPHQHFYAALLDEVLVAIVHRLGEELGRVFAFTARTELAADEEDFVHSDMQGVGLEDLDDLVVEREDDRIKVRVEQAPAPAVNVLVFGILAGRLVKLGVFRQQREGLSRPGLVAQSLVYTDGFGSRSS